MTMLGLKMVCLGSLLVLGQSASASRCVPREELHLRVRRFLRRYWDRGPWKHVQDANALGDLNNRALSPWKYRVDREENRYPENITVAECLFEGCFINQQEDFSYNSVPVYSAGWVLKKTRCHSEPNKYVFKVISVEVQVACTCAVPKYYEGD